LPFIKIRIILSPQGNAVDEIIYSLLRRTGNIFFHFGFKNILCSILFKWPCEGEKFCEDEKIKKALSCAIPSSGKEEEGV
jgi:hypothetical protein